MYEMQAAGGKVRRSREQFDDESNRKLIKYMIKRYIYIAACPPHIRS